MPESPLRWDRRALGIAGVGTFLLIAAGLAENEILLVLGLFFTGAAGLMVALPILEDFAMHFHPLRLLAGSTIGAYGFGGVLSWLAAQDPSVGGFSFILSHYQIGIQDLVIAQIAAVVFAALLTLMVRSSSASAIERRLSLYLSAEVGNPSVVRIIVAVLIGTAILQLLSLVLGVVGYRSITASDRVGAVSLLMVTLTPISPFLTGALVAHKPSWGSRFVGAWVVIAASLINAVWYFAQGRGAFVFACIIGAIGYASVRRITLGVSLFKNFVLFVPLIALVFVASQRIRYFEWVEETQKVNVLEALHLAATEASKLGEAELSESNRNNRINLAVRPITLNYPAEVISLRRNGRSDWVGFEEVWNSLLMALPRQLYPNKGSLALAEGLFSERLGTSGFDNAESIFFSAIAGFSYLGIPIFAVLMWGMVKGISSLFLLSRSWLLVSLGTASVIVLAMSGGEGAFIAWVVNMRSVAIAAPFVIALNAWLQPRVAGAPSGSPGVRRFVGMPRKS